MVILLSTFTTNQTLSIFLFFACLFEITLNIALQKYYHVAFSTLIAFLLGITI